MTDPTSDDSANLTVPASSLDPSVISVPPEDDQYTSSEGPQAVRDRAAALKRGNDRDVAEALRKATRMTRYLFFVIVVYSVLILTPVTQAVENSYHNCLRQNSALDYFNANAQTSAVLTPTQKADRDRHYADLKGHCAGIWPFQ